jgi:hypothetical protein
MSLHISDIREWYDLGKYRAKFDDELIKKLPPDYVFDENLSVKRNREMVVEHNAKVDMQRAERSTKQAELDRKLTSDVVSYIKEYYDLNERQAQMVESWVYREKHAFMSDYFANIDTFAEFAYDLLNINDEE